MSVLLPLQNYIGWGTYKMGANLHGYSKWPRSPRISRCWRHWLRLRKTLKPFKFQTPRSAQLRHPRSTSLPTGKVLAQDLPLCRQAGHEPSEGRGFRGWCDSDSSQNESFTYWVGKESHKRWLGIILIGCAHESVSGDDSMFAPSCTLHFQHSPSNSSHSEFANLFFVLSARESLDNLTIVMVRQVLLECKTGPQIHTEKESNQIKSYSGGTEYIWDTIVYGMSCASTHLRRTRHAVYSV
jgi:hypothetical protein